MNNDPENFEALKKLLALKRSEQPPPGYFDRLPGNIMVRLEAGESEPKFWEKWFGSFSTRPGLAYAFGFAICATLAFGMIYPIQNQTAQTASHSLPAAMNPAANPANQPAVAQYLPPGPILHVANWNSTNPVTDPRLAPSLFDLSNHQAVTVAYQTNN